MKKLVLATVLALAGTAGAQASTPTAAMTQFCNDLGAGSIMNAIVNMAAPTASASERALALKLSEAATGMDGDLMNQMASRSRCEVVGANGNTLTVRTAGPDADKVLAAALNDETALMNIFRAQNGGLSEEAAQAAVMQVMAQYYANPSIPLKTGTGQVVLQKDNQGHWQISDQSMDGLLDALLGGLSTLE